MSPRDSMNVIPSHEQAFFQLASRTRRRGPQQAPLLRLLGWDGSAPAAASAAQIPPSLLTVWRKRPLVTRLSNDLLIDQIKGGQRSLRQPPLLIDIGSV